MNRTTLNRLSRLEEQCGFTPDDVDASKMTDAQLIARIERADPAALAKWPNWRTMTFGEKADAIFEDAGMPNRWADAPGEIHRFLDKTQMEGMNDETVRT